jgi:threonine/homoserine/homoserine lactone efflux protein
MEALLVGLSLGFWAGVSPGPLTLLVLRQALMFGAGAGFVVALAPLITDTFAILLAWWLANQLPSGFDQAIRAAGGIFVVYLAIKGLRRPFSLNPAQGANVQSFRQGIILNMLNPNMYIFWIGVGIPLLRDFGDESAWFLAGFFPTIVLAKGSLGLLISRLRHLPWMPQVARFSNVLLLILGVYMLFKGFVGP